MNENYLSGVEKCIDYIEANLTNKINVEDIVKRSNYSYPHMHRVFADAVGNSIGTYLRKRRLSRAAEDLRSTKLTITDIALSYDFGSQQTFTRAFTDFFGISPLKYRESSSSDEEYARFDFDKDFLRRLKPVDVKIETLEPFTYAEYYVYKEKIKAKNLPKAQDKVVAEAWNGLINRQMVYEYKKRYGADAEIPEAAVLGKFMVENRLHVAPNTRYFGYNKPYPYDDGEFGYAACAEIRNLSDGTFDDDVEIKSLDGGLYATAYADFGKDARLDDVWKYLHYWLAENKQYIYGERLWFEEHLTKTEVGGFHGFKLFLPIEMV